MNFHDDAHWFTSYPALNHWTEDFTHSDYVEALGKFNGPLHLYLHIPFCAKLCYYCLCNVIISNNRQKIQFFLDYLIKELRLLKAFKPDIKDLHFGGGTPSHLDQDQFSQLCSVVNELTDLKSLKEVAMEIDPRTVTQDDLRHYASHGVNRISFGIQDFDPQVQQAINRIQSPEMIDALLTSETRKLFNGVNFDLLYGLPLQTLETLAQTIERVMVFRPDRITLLKYCHAPDVRRHMKLIDQTQLPVNLREMFIYCVKTLQDAGYLWVGLDHFVLPSDSLAKKVGRTFIGFTSGTTEIVGVGPTSTMVFGDVYCQSQYDINKYYNAVDKGEFPIQRGYRMSADDLKRREVIFSLLCHQKAELDTEYFESEIATLKKYRQACDFSGNTLYITDRFYLRNVCNVFDVIHKPEHFKCGQLSMTRKTA